MQDKQKIFIDTNVLLYLMSNDHKKKVIAKEMLKSSSNVSIQVLSEFSNVCIKKFKLSSEDIIIAIQKISEKSSVLRFDENTIESALLIKQKYKFQYYDSLILATALENSCTILYSEDMQHEQLIENNLTIVNPFLK